MFKFIKDLIVYIYLSRKGVIASFGKTNLVGFPIIQKYPGSRIVLGANVTLVSKTKGNIIGINHPVILATLSKDSEIIICDGSGLSGSSIVSAKSIQIGKNVGIGANSNIFDTDFHPVNFKNRIKQKNILDAKSLAVKIDDGVWIGFSVTVLKGVHIGQQSVIGACSLVTKSIKPYSIVAGNPIRFIRKLI